MPTLFANKFHGMTVKDIKLENIFRVQHSEGEKLSQRCPTCGTSSASLPVTAVSPDSIRTEHFYGKAEAHSPFSLVSFRTLLILFLLPTKLHLAHRLPAFPEILLIPPLPS